MTRRSRLVARPRLERLDERCVLSSLTPSQLNSAYGLNAVTFANGTIKGTGEGQTIAIVDAYFDPTLLSDLATFDRINGLTNLTPTATPVVNLPTSSNPGSLTVYNLAGSAVDQGWSGETALDVEMAHAAAPGANIVLVEARSGSISDLLAAVNVVKGIPGVSVVSMSWGGAEFRGENVYDSTFTTPAGHSGITFVAAAGDSGAGAEWPASSPNVVAVGGTSLSVNTFGTRAAETYWSASGGGYSRYEAQPAYQNAVQSTGRRSVPDVSLDANPNDGVFEVSGGKTFQVGGTSLGSPVFAGLIAIADQGLALQGKGSLDGATQTLPALYAAPAGAFHDITTGPGYRATVGYDTATGLGTPNAVALVGDLVNGVSHFLSTTAGFAAPSSTTTAATGATATTPSPTGTNSGGTTVGGTTPQPPAPWHPPFWWLFSRQRGSTYATGIGQSAPGQPYWL